MKKFNKWRKRRKDERKTECVFVRERERGGGGGFNEEESNRDG